MKSTFYFKALEGGQNSPLMHVPLLLKEGMTVKQRNISSNELLTVYHKILPENIQTAVLPKIRCALCAVSQLPGRGPTGVEDAPASAC